jgi:hypothetical protein
MQYKYPFLLGKAASRSRVGTDVPRRLLENQLFQDERPLCFARSNLSGKLDDIILQHKNKTQ